MKGFLMKQALKMQLRKLPKEQQEMAQKMMDEKPELLAQLAEELQAELKQGKDQMSAMMAVAGRHQEELQQLMGGK